MGPAASLAVAAGASLRAAAALLTRRPPGGGLHPLLAIAALAAFGAVHSALASHSVKRWVLRATGGAPDRPRGPALRYYRLLYTAVSVATAAPLAALAARDTAAPVVAHGGRAAVAAAVVHAAAAACLARSLCCFDLLAFVGLRQALAADMGAADNGAADKGAEAEGVAEPMPMTIGGFHRYVRHPWYFFSLLMAWTRPSYTPAQLALALGATAYVAVGSRLEERKLTAAFGAAYATYSSLVPGLVPMPPLWSVSAAQAAQLMADSARHVALVRPVLDDM